MDRTRQIITRTALLAALSVAAVGGVHAQEQTYSLALREVALSDAVERFVDATGLAVSYEPALVRGQTASCAAKDIAAEAVLECILRDSGIDFYRLSSGTYVLTESVEVAPERGYLAGRVTDVETGGPLSGAHVRLADAGLGAVTDRSGRFVLPALLPGPYVLSVSHLGYRPWTDSLVIRPREQVRAEASLRPENIFITPVVVDGMQGRRSAESLGRPALDAAEAPVGGAAGPVSASYGNLQALSGVRLNDVTADAHVQGGDPGTHQLRLDDVPVFLPRSVAGLVGPFGSFALEKIRVHQAGYGAAHGSQLSGVLAGEHALASVNDFDVQADPYSLNARLRLAPETGGERSVAAMAAGRIGLWDVLTPSRLATTLDGWSRPDPFLVLGPLDDPDADHAYSDPSSLLDAPVNPTLQFSDLHAAARLRFGPLHTLHASLYQGRQRLGGGVFSAKRIPQAENARSDLTVVDEYDWMNRLGQVRYDAVIGSRTLASIQLRASHYRLRHEYETLDSLHAVLRDSTLELASLSTVSVHDGNRISWLALESTVDYAVNRHHVQLGAETGLIDSGFDLHSVFFPTAAFGSDEQPGSGADGFIDVESERRSVQNASDAWYAAAFAQDRIRFGEGLDLEFGSRLTYVHARRTAYAEPRVAITYGAADARVGTWNARTSAGIYRQYLNQTDASKLNTGALLPSVRIWLPVDATVRPPMAYHLAQDVLFEPVDHWSLRVNAYLKYKPHDLALAYAPADSIVSSIRHVRQSEFLVAAREMGYGGNVTLSWTSSHVRAEARYGYEFARRESSELFGGRKHASPWSEPHRMELAADWIPNERLAISARWRSVWGRSWGFRRAYYDYFGHDDDTRTHPPFDLGDPGSHRLPPIHQIDLTAAYTQPLGDIDVQIRGDVINVLNRENVLDWRLVRDGTTWRKEARTLYPMIPSLAVRIGM